MPGQTPVRIVIIDDHEDLRLLLSMLLTTDDRFDLVAQASDGFEGLRIVDELRPDMVVVDLAMPGVDGLQMLDHCHRRWPTLPIVSVLSSFNRAIMGPIAMEHGAVAYIEKDVTLGTTVLEELWDVWTEHGAHRLAAS